MFEPDYRNIVDCAWNREAKRLPLYEHNVSSDKIGEMIGKDITPLLQGELIHGKRYQNIISIITLDISVPYVTKCHKE